MGPLKKAKSWGLFLLSNGWAFLKIEKNQTKTKHKKLLLIETDENIELSQLLTS